MIYFLFALVALLLSVILWIRIGYHMKFPPGPTVLPYVGNVFSFGERPHLTMLAWREKYGDTFRCYIGKKMLVVMNNFETVRKTFASDDTSGRDQTFILNVLCKNHGIAISQGNLWKVHRRFALSTLRDFGMGKSRLEDAIIGEVEDLCKMFASLRSKPFDPKIVMSHSVANVICALVFGKRYHHSDQEFSRLTNLLTELTVLMPIDPVLQLFPFLKYIPNRFRRDYRSMQTKLETINDFLKVIIAEHREKYTADDIRDYIDAYIYEERAQPKQGNSDNTFTETQLIFSLFDIFGAGTETMSTTLMWGLALMLEHPEVMSKVQYEIDHKVGRERVIRMTDKAMLPFTEATLMEIQRFASIVPLGLTHQATEDIVVDGFTVPKGALLAANLNFIHHDPQYWETPDKFSPDRFLDANGKVIRHEHFIPFSIGKRSCLGEALAKMELFLYFSNLLRRFSIMLPPGETISHRNYVPGMMILPPRFQASFRIRNSCDNVDRTSERA